MAKIIYESELQHHGIIGQKWGIRRFQNKDGSLTAAGRKRKWGIDEFDNNKDQIIKKGTIVKRVAENMDDKIGSEVYNSRKYVSINQEDHDKWMENLGNTYLSENILTYQIKYKTKNDLRVMSSAKQGELYSKMLMDSDFKKQALKDTELARKYWNLKKSTDLSENISRNIAVQTETGKKFIDQVLKNNYDAVIDTHGTNVSKNPVIILNADKNLKRTNKLAPAFTKPVSDYLDELYKRGYRYYVTSGEDNKDLLNVY